MAGFRRAKITAEVVARLAPGEIVMDVDQPGFGVRCQKDARTFFIRKYSNGRRHFETIGEFGTGGLTVSIARNKASRAIAAIKDGFDPAKQRARDRTMPTVAEFADHWLETYVKAKLKPATAAAYASSITTFIVPAMGVTRIDQIESSAVERMHYKARSTPYAANKALAVLSKLANHAEREGYRPANSNPTKHIERYREERRERFLSSDELAELGMALSSSEVRERHSPFAISALGLLLLTGMRLREVLHLRWREVDLERGLLLLSDSKTGRKPVVLGLHAIHLISSQPRVLDSPWVFPSSISPSKPMADVKKAWRTVARVAGIEGVRVHDLRHSFAAFAASSGGSLPMIGRLLGHKQAQTTARYAHLAHDPLRGLADQTTSFIAGTLDPRSGRQEQ